MLNSVKRANSIARSLVGEMGQNKSEAMQRERMQEWFHTKQDHALGTDLCIQFVKTIILTGI